MCFLVCTKSFGLSSHCKHLNKELTALLTAVQIENTWKLTKHNGNNWKECALLIAECRIQLFKPLFFQL